MRSKSTACAATIGTPMATISTTNRAKGNPTVARTTVATTTIRAATTATPSAPDRRRSSSPPRARHGGLAFERGSTRMQQQLATAPRARTFALRLATWRVQRIGSAVIVLALAALALDAGCGGGGRRAPAHPLTNTLDESYATLAIKTLAALPFSSDISDDEDPDKVAAAMAEAKFYQALTVTHGYTVLPANEVARILAAQNLTDAKAAFDKKWMNDPSGGDADFIKKVAAVLNTDGVIAGAVDVWHQQPVDV